jgi:hypothetical protein
VPDNRFVYVGDSIFVQLADKFSVVLHDVSIDMYDLEICSEG